MTTRMPPPGTNIENSNNDVADYIISVVKGATLAADDYDPKHGTTLVFSNGMVGRAFSPMKRSGQEDSASLLFMGNASEESLKNTPIGSVSCPMGETRLSLRQQDSHDEIASIAIFIVFGDGAGNPLFALSIDVEDDMDEKDMEYFRLEFSGVN